MNQILDARSLRRVKNRIVEYERLIAQRRRIDKRLAEIARELGGVGAAKVRPRRRLTQAERRARSIAMKRYWAEKKKAEAKAKKAPKVKEQVA